MRKFIPHSPLLLYAMKTLVALIIFTLVVASPVPEKVENNLVDYYAYIDEDYVYEDNVTQYLDHRPPPV